jgi:restriction system protein
MIEMNDKGGESPLSAGLAEPRCYLVRTIDELVNQGVVGLGWVDFRFSEIGNAEEVIRQINDDYGIGRYANQIRRFFAIAEGDLVVAPLPYCVAVGRVKGDLFFDERYYQVDRANQRRVEFPRDENGRVLTIPRDAFSEAFQRRLRVMGIAVNDLGEFSDEIVRNLTTLESGGDRAWVVRLNVEKQKQMEKFQIRLLENIQSGRTNLQAGGVGLENLVCELLRLDGYEARVLSKRHFGSFADADVEASRSERFSLVRLLVQVKHHQGFSNEHGLNQLREIRQAHPGDYDDHLPVFVTSASVSDEIKNRAEEGGIKVIDGWGLAGWIGEHVERLEKRTKESLGIYEVPAVI